jgi:4-amino-4-deoxy-L-arabinose transferase-like glycosyltransferase
LIFAAPYISEFSTRHISQFAKVLDFAPIMQESAIEILSTAEGPAQISWPAVLVAVFVVSTCLLSGIGVIGLLGPDEPRYLNIARAMLQSGDWVTPRLLGDPWFEKPPLFYWAAALSFRMFGASEFAGRLPSALGALITTLAIGWTALRIYGLNAAGLAILFFSTTIGAMAAARSATPDMLFSAMLALCCVAAAETLTHSRAPRAAPLLFGFFLAAATLAKGPAAVVLAGGALALWAALSGQWRPLLTLARPLPIAVFFLTAAPWYVLCSIRNPEFPRTFFYQHNVERYLTPLFQHVQPIWYSALALGAAGMPWTVLLLPLLIHSVRTRASREWRYSPNLFFACWAIFPVLFFSFSQSQLASYILPALAPLAVLLASDATRYLAAGAKAGRWWTAVLASLLCLLLLLAAHAVRLSPSGAALSRTLVALQVVTIGGTAACCALALRGRIRAAISLEAVLIAALLLGVSARVLPQLEPDLSSRAVFRSAPEEARSATNLTAFELGRSWQYGLEFYLNRPLPSWTPGSPNVAWIWTTPEGASKLQQLGVPCTVERRLTSKVWLLREK